MKHIILKILILGLAIHGYSQTPFIKIIDYDSLSQSSQQILKAADGGYLVGYYQTCDDLLSQCSGILKIDEDGKVTKKLKLENFSNNPNSIMIDGDKILLTGEEYYTDDALANKYQVYELDTKLTVKKSYYVKDDKNPYINMFQVANTKWNNKLVIAGSGNKVNAGSRALLYIYNVQNKLDTLIKIDHIVGNMAPIECYIDRDNNLTIHLLIHDWIKKEKYESFMKFDTTYKKIKEWRNYPKYLSGAIPFGFEAKNGNTIINTYNDDASAINDVTAVSKDSSILWKMRWNALWPHELSEKGRYIDRLRPAKNGDILGVGRYTSFVNVQPYMKDLPFIFRLDQNGNLLWLKVYYKNQTYPSNNPAIKYLLQGEFSDVIEADNGDLITVGRIHNTLDYDPRVFGPRTDWDIIIARLGPDGCLEPGCGELNIIDPLTTTITDVALPDFKINIYPNPVAGDEVTIAIQSDHDLDHLEITIHDLTGKQIARDKAINGDNKINISQAGYYLVTVTSDGKVIYNNKLIKI
jgi:thioredoxin-related protein